MCQKGPVLHCRLCLRNKMSMIDIFSQGDDGNAMKDVIEDVLNFKILDSNEFPRTICGDCCSKIMGYKCFKSMCIKSKEILWRKFIEKTILNEDTELGVPVAVDNQPDLVANHTTSLNTVNDDSQGLGGWSCKTELCEDDSQERSQNDLGNVQNIQCNENAKPHEAEEVAYDNRSISSLSTLIRCDESESMMEFVDEESIHLHWSSSESDVSVTNSIKGEALNGSKALKIKEKSSGMSYGYPITECSVVLVRCDIDKYKTSLPCLRGNTTLEEKSNKSQSGLPFPCSDCWISFSSLSSLLSHKKYTHCKKICDTSIEVGESNNVELHEIFPHMKETEKVIETVQTQEKSKIIEVNSSRGNFSNGLKLKKTHSVETVIPSVGESSLEGVKTIIPCCQSSQTELKDRTVKRVPIKGKKKIHENSSFGRGDSKVVDSTRNELCNNYSEKAKRKPKCNMCRKALPKNHSKLQKKLSSYLVCKKNLSTKFSEICYECVNYNKKCSSYVHKKCYQSIANVNHNKKVLSITRPFQVTECSRTLRQRQKLKLHY